MGITEDASMIVREDDSPPVEEARLFEHWLDAFPAAVGVEIGCERGLDARGTDVFPLMLLLLGFRLEGCAHEPAHCA